MSLLVSVQAQRFQQSLLLCCIALLVQLAAASLSVSLPLTLYLSLPLSEWLQAIHLTHGDINSFSVFPGDAAHLTALSCCLI